MKNFRLGSSNKLVLDKRLLPSSTSIDVKYVYELSKKKLVTDSNTNDVLINERMNGSQQQQPCCCNNIHTNKAKSRLTIRQFTKDYVNRFHILKRRIISSSNGLIGDNSQLVNYIGQNDDKLSNMISNLAGFDNKYIFLHYCNIVFCANQ